MNQQNQFELIFVFYILLFCNLKYLPKLLMNNIFKKEDDEVISYYEMKFSQLTIWNLIIISSYFVLKIMNVHNVILYEFITINSIGIFVAYHALYYFNYKLIFDFPLLTNMSFIKFHTYSCLAHVLPVIYFTYNYESYLLEHNSDCNICNIGFYSMLLKLFWCFSLQDFNIAKLYSLELSHRSRITLKITLMVHYLAGLYFSGIKNDI